MFFLPTFASGGKEKKREGEREMGEREERRKRGGEGRKRERRRKEKGEGKGKRRGEREREKGGRGEREKGGKERGRGKEREGREGKREKGKRERRVTSGVPKVFLPEIDSFRTKKKTFSGPLLKIKKTQESTPIILKRIKTA